jgi:hypothetical protein
MISRRGGDLFLKEPWRIREGGSPLGINGGGRPSGDRGWRAQWFVVDVRWRRGMRAPLEMGGSGRPWRGAIGHGGLLEETLLSQRGATFSSLTKENPKPQIYEEGALSKKDFQKKVFF